MKDKKAMRKKDIRRQIKHTERALIGCFISIGMSFIFLIGMTYAWYTASVTTASNVIRTGQFAVNVYYSTTLPDNDTGWTALSSNNTIFNEGNATISPNGVPVTRFIKVVNAGDYDVSVKIAIPNGSTGSLTNYLHLYYKGSVTQADVTAGIAIAENQITTTEKGADTVLGDLVEAGGYYEIPSTLTIPAHSSAVVALAFKLDENTTWQQAGQSAEFRLQFVATQIPTTTPGTP